MRDAPLHALDAPSPIGLSHEEKLVWILGDLMNAVENYFGAENPKRLGHINCAAIRIIDEILSPIQDRMLALDVIADDEIARRKVLATRLEKALNDASRYNESVHKAERQVAVLVGALQKISTEDDGLPTYTPQAMVEIAKRALATRLRS